MAKSCQKLDYFALVFHKTKFCPRLIRPAGVAKLADALDLGSSAYGVWVQVPPSAPVRIEANCFRLGELPGANHLVLTIAQPLVYGGTFLEELHCTKALCFETCLSRYF